MKVIEIFESVQGEGRWMGTPVVFVRLAGCNLHCPWCDTKESWGDVGTEMTLQEIRDTVNKYNIMTVVITGGEPTVHPDLKELTRILHNDCHYVCIETNGTNELTHDDGISWITCSPKPESHYVIKCAADEIKIVITEDLDEKVVTKICDENIHVSSVWLQPNGYDMKNMWKRCYDLCLKYKGLLRVGVQLHKLMEVR